MTALAVAVTIRREEVLRHLGYPDGRAPSPPIADLLDEEIAEARALARPRGTFRRLPPARAADLGLAPVPAAELVIGLVTVGPLIEERAAAHGAAGTPTRALLLEAAGSVAAEEAADRLGAEIVGARGDPPTLPCRQSPGYPGWPLTAQPRLFQLLDFGAVGVRLLPSLMMVPRKSISFALWLGAAAPPGAGRAGCARCALTGCRYRRR